jgi:hypothetical protein
MIYYALAVITATSVNVVDIYTTREPCASDARQLWQMMQVKPQEVACVPTTEGDAESAEIQLTNIQIFLKQPQKQSQ